MILANLIACEYNYSHILRQFHYACHQINLECDMLSVKDNFSNYPLLIVPTLYSASEDTLSKTKDHVKNGSHLLLGFKSGRRIPDS